MTRRPAAARLLRCELCTRACVRAASPMRTYFGSSASPSVIWHPVPPGRPSRSRLCRFVSSRVSMFATMRTEITLPRWPESQRPQSQSPAPWSSWNLLAMVLTGALSNPHRMDSSFNALNGPDQRAVYRSLGGPPGGPRCPGPNRGWPARFWSAMDLGCLAPY